MLTRQRDAAGRSEHQRRADRGVPGKRQFGRGREYAQPRGVVGILRRQHEHGLGEVHLARDPLHPGIVDAVAVGEHGQRIAAEHPVGEDVRRMEPVCHGSLLPFSRAPRRAA